MRETTDGGICVPLGAHDEEISSKEDWNDELKVLCSESTPACRPIKEE